MSQFKGRPQECINGTELTSGDLIGLTITAETGLLSAAAILVVMLLVGRQVVRNLRGSPKSRPIIKTHLDLYMISLLVSDSLQAIGAVMDLRWIRAGRSYCGGFCDAQGAIQTLGETTVALATLVIAIHTFSVIAFRWTPPRGFLVPSIIIFIIWGYVAIYTGVMFAKHSESYVTPTPYWCWISSRFPSERISQEYFWLWFACVFSIILYIPLFFIIRGNIEIDPSRRFYHISFHRLKGRKAAGAAHSTFSPSRQSMKMLLYPACYILVILPMTIVRWIGFTNGNRIAPTWTFFAVSIFGLSGIINVLLLTLTRPSILSFGASTTETVDRGVTAGRTTAASFRFAHGTTRGSVDGDFEDEGGRQRGGGVPLSVSVHVQQDLYEDSQGSYGKPDSKVPYSPPRSLGRSARDLVTSLRPPTPVYALQDMRDKDKI